MIIDDILNKGLNDIHLGNTDVILQDFIFWYCYRLHWIRNCWDNRSCSEGYNYMINRIIRYIVDVTVDKIHSVSDNLSHNFMCDYIITLDEHTSKSTISETLDIRFDYIGNISFIGKYESKTITACISELETSLERWKLLNY